MYHQHILIHYSHSTSPQMQNDAYNSDHKSLKCDMGHVHHTMGYPLGLICCMMDGHRWIQLHHDRNMCHLQDERLTVHTVLDMVGLSWYPIAAIDPHTCQQQSQCHSLHCWWWRWVARCETKCTIPMRHMIEHFVHLDIDPRCVSSTYNKQPNDNTIWCMWILYRWVMGILDGKILSRWMRPLRGHQIHTIGTIQIWCKASATTL